MPFLGFYFVIKETVVSIEVNDLTSKWKRLDRNKRNQNKDVLGGVLPTQAGGPTKTYRNKLSTSLNLIGRFWGS